MLFGTFGAPAPPRSTNPLLIVLGVCGGCVLVVVAGVIIMSAIAANTFKGVIRGTVEMTKTMPAFLADLKAHNYEGAAGLVDPAAQATLNASKIRAIEDSVEKKLGPLQSYKSSPSSQRTNNAASPGDSTGRPTIVEYIYEYPLTYEKGTATATFKFVLDASGVRSGNFGKMKLSGKVMEFSIQPNKQ